MSGRQCGHDGSVVGRRCDECRRNARERKRVKIAWRRRLLAEDPSLREHGTHATYDQWGCRCRPCTNAANARRRSYMSTAQPFGREWLADG